MVRSSCLQKLYRCSRFCLGGDGEVGLLGEGCGVGEPPTNLQKRCGTGRVRQRVWLCPATATPDTAANTTNPAEGTVQGFNGCSGLVAGCGEGNHSAKPGAHQVDCPAFSAIFQQCNLPANDISSWTPGNYCQCRATGVAPLSACNCACCCCCCCRAYLLTVPPPCLPYPSSHEPLFLVLIRPIKQPPPLKTPGSPSQRPTFQCELPARDKSS